MLQLTRSGRISCSAPEALPWSGTSLLRDAQLRLRTRRRLTHPRPRSGGRRQSRTSTRLRRANGYVHLNAHARQAGPDHGAQHGSLRLIPATSSCTRYPSDVGTATRLMTVISSATEPVLSRDDRRLAWASDAESRRSGGERRWDRRHPRHSASHGFSGRPEVGPAWHPYDDRLIFVTVPQPHLLPGRGGRGGLGDTVAVAGSGQPRRILGSPVGRGPARNPVSVP